MAPKMQILGMIDAAVERRVVMERRYGEGVRFIHIPSSVESSLASFRRSKAIETAELIIGRC